MKYTMQVILITTLFIFAQEHTMEEITITAGKRDVKQEDAIVTVEIIDRAQIDMSGATSVMDVVTSVPYIQQLPHNGENYLQFQGLEGAYVVILQDGVPTTGDIMSGQFPIDNIDLNQVERIEITKGPNSVLYGSSAMAGTINIITKRNYGEKKSAGNISVEYGSKNLFNSRGYLYHRFDRLSISATGGALLDDGLTERHEGAISYNKYILPAVKNFSGAFETNFQRSETGIYRLKYAHNSRLRKSTNVKSQSIRINQEDRTNSVNFSYEEKGDRLEFAGYLAYQNYSHKEDAYRVTTGKDEYATDYVFNDIEGEQRIFIPISFLSLTAGINGQYESTSNSDLVTPDHDRSTGALFSQLNAELGPVVLEAGGRAIYNTIYGWNGAAHVGLKWDVVEPLQIRLSAGRGYRVPSFKDLYYYWEHPAPLFLVIGNPDLTPEISRSGHFQLNFKPIKMIELDLSVFGHNFENKIGYTDPMDPDNNSIAQAINIDESWRAGGDIMLSLNLGLAKVSAGYNHTRGKDTEAGEESDPFEIIPHSFTYSTDFYAPFDISVNFNGKVNAERLYPDASSYEPEVLNMLNGAVRKGWIDNRLVTTIGVRNIFNSKTTEFNQQEGINVYGRVGFSF